MGKFNTIIFFVLPLIFISLFFVCRKEANLRSLNISNTIGENIIIEDDHVSSTVLDEIYRPNVHEEVSDFGDPQEIADVLPGRREASPNINDDIVDLANGSNRAIANALDALANSRTATSLGRLREIWECSPSSFDQIDNSVLEKAFPNAAIALERTSPSANYLNSESISQEVREIIRQISVLRFDRSWINMSSYQNEVAFYDRWAIHELDDFLSGGDLELSFLYDSLDALPRDEHLGSCLVSELLWMASRLRCDSMANIFYQYSSGEGYAARLNAQRGIVQVRKVPETSALFHRYYLRDDYLLELLLFEIGRSQNLEYIPFLLDSLTKVKQMIEVGHELDIKRLFSTKKIIGESLVRLTGYSFSAVEENENPENWIKLLDAIENNNANIPNYIENLFQALLQQALDLDVSTHRLTLQFNDFFTGRGLNRSGRSGVHDLFVLSQFGNSYVSKLLEQFKLLDDGCCLNPSKFELLWNVINIGGADAEEFLSQYISQDVVSTLGRVCIRKTLIAFDPNVNRRPYLNVPAIVCPHSLALFGAIMLRSKLCLNGIMHAIEHTDDWLIKSDLLLAVGFIEPNESLVPVLIDALGQDDLRIFHTTIVWALVLNSGHTFGNMNADSNPQAWDIWWNTPAEHRVR
ncbi:MAG: hypothetical protein NUW37_14570 [Planctomycetes bacterium]|nr:hypothetical protein [Planctomycetota bacterium]